MDLTKPDGTIDVSAIIHDRFPGAPGWVCSLARRIMREDFLNEFLRRGHEGVEFCTKSVEYLQVKVEVEGLDRVPLDGRYTFASNHPLGGIDGVTLGGIIGERFDGKVKFLVNDFLLALKGLRPLVIGVNKVGAQARNLVAETDAMFASDVQVLIFPAGLCSRKIDGVVQDLPWSKTFITKSVQSGRDIVPVHFYGENSKLFYNVATLQKKLGIKAPIAMAMLPGELVKGYGKTFRVVFGDPIPVSTFDKSRKPAQWAAWVRDKVYQL